MLNYHRKPPKELYAQLDFGWQYPASEGKKKVLTFKKQIKIEAGEKLQVKIGENNPHASPKSSSVINYLKIWQLP